MTIEPLDVGSKKTLLFFCSLLRSQREERPGIPHRIQEARSPGSGTPLYVCPNDRIGLVHAGATRGAANRSNTE